MLGKRFVVFIDDFNMPTPDKYGTQSAIALLRQQVDYLLTDSLPYLPYLVGDRPAQVVGRLLTY